VLLQALSGIEVFRHPNVLVGYETADDAGVYLLDDQTALVQTVDFFTPIVDDPFIFGQIAAANALSDLYAMGAKPLFALAVLGFNSHLGPQVLHQLLAGGADKMREAEVSILGGHSVKAQELNFGYAVTGIALPNRIYRNCNARPGDVLLLTKPLGTGLISTGIKRAVTPPQVAAEGIRWMLQLNRAASREFPRFDVHAVTDVTGYGLLGHAFEMASASHVTFRIESGRVPLIDGVLPLARAGLFPGGQEANRRLLADNVRWNDTPPLWQKILLDPQTSGGLLISLPPADARSLQQSLQADAAAYEIGSVHELEGFSLDVR
jgi:selenide,water dikinase